MFIATTLLGGGLALLIGVAVFGAMALGMSAVFGAGRFGNAPMWTPDQDYYWTDPVSGVERHVGVKGVPMPLTDAVRYGMVSVAEARKLSGQAGPSETKAQEQASIQRADTYVQAGSAGATDAFMGVQPMATPARPRETPAPATPTPGSASPASATGATATGTTGARQTTTRTATRATQASSGGAGTAGGQTGAASTIGQNAAQTGPAGTPASSGTGAKE